jgi:transcriptional regulator with XRE-family HTH domain
LKSVYTDEYGEFLQIMIAARKQAGLTQQQLAELLSKPQSYVSKYERGERRLDVIEFLNIVKLLELNPCYVLEKLNDVGK